MHNIHFFIHHLLFKRIQAANVVKWCSTIIATVNSSHNTYPPLKNNQIGNSVDWRSKFWMTSLNSSHSSYSPIMRNQTAMNRKESLLTETTLLKELSSSTLMSGLTNQSRIGWQRPMLPLPVSPSLCFPLDL